MNVAIGSANLLIGFAYVFVGLLVIQDMRQNWKLMGFSHFGGAFVLLAFTCGPHHLFHGMHVLFEGRTGGALDLATVLVGVPPGLVFVWLRMEALFGGRGDRFISGTPAWLAALPTVAGIYATALVAAAFTQDFELSMVRQVAPNLVLIVVYSAVGYFILRTQLRNRPTLGGWSASGLSLSLIFLTCIFMHATYALYASAGVFDDIDWHGWVVDYVSIPAGLYFLWVVRNLYRHTITDWNRFSYDSVPDRSAAVVASL